MVPPDGSILPVQAVADGQSGADLDLPGLTPKPVYQPDDGGKDPAPAGILKADGATTTDLAKLVPQGTRLAIEKDDESGKLVVRVKDAVTGEVIRQLPPEEMLRIARSIERYLGLFVDRKS